MANPQSTVVLDGSALTAEQVARVSREGWRVRVDAGAMERMARSRAVVEAHLADGEAHYGINTGFGSLSRKRVGDGDLGALQHNLVRSHAAGVGAPLGADVVRGMMLLLAASLCRGMSGVRPVVVERLVEMLNGGLTPRVPEVGSVGASGDLAPLAHVALALIGEGEVIGAFGADREGGGEGLSRLEPIQLQAKEGLALINGTHLMAAQAALLSHDLDLLFDGAMVAAAMSIDACRGTDAFLDERVYGARNHRGPGLVAARLRELLRGSQIVASHRENDPRVQDPYSLRCAPAVIGAALDAAEYFKRATEAELGAVTDNPLVFEDLDGGRAKQPSPHPLPKGRGDVRPAIVSAGNFHGMPIAIPLDAVAVAIAHVAGISERRTYYLLSATDSENPVPAYLSPRPGLHSGLMIAQYTAAACCNEIVGLCMPASVVNVPTSAGMEDYNSFGPRAAAKARRALELATSVVAVELMCAAEALEYQRPLLSGAGVERAHAKIRAGVTRLSHDRPLSPDIERIARMVRDGELARG